MADIVHTVVLVTGLALLVVQRIQLKSQEGLNEAVQKPDFDQVRGRMHVPHVHRTPHCRRCRRTCTG